MGSESGSEKNVKCGGERPAVCILCRDARLVRGLSLFLADMGLDTVGADGNPAPSLILLDADGERPPSLPADVPTIAFTCGRDRTVASENRFYAMLHRPLALDELEAVLRSCLNLRPAPPAAAAASRPASSDGKEKNAEPVTAVPDGNAGVLRSGDKEIRLTPTEWALYVRLRTAGGSPVTREALADCTESMKKRPGSQPERETDVFICYLRRKLAKLPGAGRIDTVRGNGYRLIP